MIVVRGESSSGKSKIAEDIAVKLSKDRQDTEQRALFYLATMETSSPEAADRIRRHRAMREGKGFVTIEKEMGFMDISEEVRDGILLLECVSNLIVNHIYDRYRDEAVPEDEWAFVVDEIMEDLTSLAGAKEVILVTNRRIESETNPWLSSYMNILQMVNERLFEKADIFVEVVDGRSQVVKGELMWLS